MFSYYTQSSDSQTRSQSFCTNCLLLYVYVYITFHGITEYVKKKTKLKVPLFFTHIQTGVSQHNTMHYIYSCSQVIKHM